MEEIRQNGKAVIWSNDKVSIPLIFNNLIDANFNGSEYRNYIRSIAIPEMGFTHGRISLYVDGKFTMAGTVPDV